MPFAVSEHTKAVSSGVCPRQRAGLVSSQTSGTPTQPIRIDPKLSRLSRMRRRILTGARLHVAQVPKFRAAMLTLTYAPGIEWDARHISECLRLMRQHLKRRGLTLRYVWSLEMTKANRPHYHIVVWLPFGRKLPKLDDAGWWPHGSTRMEWARHAVGYISKYVSKGHEADQVLPEGARMYSVGGLEGAALDEARWWALPGWLRESVQVGTFVRRRPGGGWIDKETGERYVSPWRVQFIRGELWIVRAAAPSIAPAGGEAGKP